MRRGVVGGGGDGGGTALCAPAQYGPSLPPPTYNLSQAFVTAAGRADAFWLGNLASRDVTGRRVASQLPALNLPEPAEEEDDDESEDESEGEGEEEEEMGETQAAE